MYLDVDRVQIQLAPRLVEDDADRLHTLERPVIEVEIEPQLVTQRANVARQTKVAAQRHVRSKA